MITTMRKGEKQPKMVFKNHYDLLSREKKIELRDEFLRQSGVSLPSFYNKMSGNSFKPLEVNLLRRLLNESINDKV
nr:MAG TPA: hypothetical protein [Siphoviridae sp. ctCCX1]DAX15633.1 MAG TPA: hypothetical protein [Caudoviricetes sp.]